MVYFKLSDFKFYNKKVLVRMGADVPVSADGTIIDDSRIQLSLPTLRHILNQDPAQVILMCHLGRPKNNEANLKTNKVAEKLSTLLNHPITKVDDWGETALPKDKIIFLENLRFNPGEKDKDAFKRDAFGKQLASLADLFVQDAFSNCHRDHASMTSVTRYIPSCMGYVVDKEISSINDVMQNPKKPFVSIIGGLKADKLNAIKILSQRADKILVAGALAFTVLKHDGYNVGASKIDSEGLQSMKEMLDEIKKTGKMVLPVDAIIADKFDANANSQIVEISKIPDNWLALDIGPESLKKYCEELKSAKTIIWNGPIGVFEFEKFSQGTRVIAKTLADMQGIARVIIGGGDSAEVIHSLGYENKMTLVSSGGGASLELFEGKKLVVVAAMETNYDQFRGKF